MPLSSQDLGSPSATQTVRDSQRQSELRRQGVRTETKRLLTLAEPIKCPCSTATSLGAGTCVGRVGCTAVSVIHSGKSHTNEPRPRGDSHLLLCIFITFACRAETTLVRNRVEASVILPAVFTTRAFPSSHKPHIFIPFWSFFFFLWW